MFKNAGKIDKLLAKGPRGKSPRAQKDGDSLELWIYGAIGGYWEGVDALEVNQAIAEFDGSEIVLHINSEGGDVFAGVSIANAVQQSAANVTAINEGLAASAASVIFQAGSVRVAMPSTRQMIHNAWTIGMGNRHELREVADILEGIDEDLTTMYAEASGMDQAEVGAMLDAETWLSAEDSVEKGFADQIGPAENATRSRFELLRAKVRLQSLTR